MSTERNGGKSIWKILIYLVLLILPLYFMLQFFLAVFAVVSLSNLVNMEIDNWSLQQQFHVLKVLTHHFNGIEKAAVELDPGGWGTEAREFSADYPEVVAVFQGTTKGYVPLFPSRETEEVKSNLQKAAESLVERNTFNRVAWSAKWQRMYGSIPGETERLTYILLESDDDRRSIVIDPAKLKNRLEGIFMEYGRNENGFYLQKSLTPGSGALGQIIFTDSSGEEFLKLGETRGTEWKGWEYEVKQARRDLEPRLPWNIDFRVFIYGDALKLILDYSEKSRVGLIIKLVVSIICIALLGHFSPKLHGYSKPAKY